MSTTIITVANQKGGVGKTTTAVSIAHGLTLLGRGVLLVDLDPQGQAAVMLGVDRAAGAYNVLTSHLSGMDPRTTIKPTGRRGLGIIPGNEATSSAQVMLVSAGAPVSHVRDVLSPIAGNGNGPDAVILDTAPSVGGVLERAVWAAHIVLAPTTCDFMSLHGLVQMIETLGLLHSGTGWNGTLLVLPTFYDENTKETKYVLAELRAKFGERLLEPIHRATVLRECTASGKTIFEYDGSSRAAQEYQAATERITRVV